MTDFGIVVSLGGIAVAILGHAVVVALQIFKGPKESIAELVAEVRNLRNEFNTAGKQLERHDALLASLDKTMTRLIDRFDKMEANKGERRGAR
jgi:hypothetical protein